MKINNDHTFLDKLQETLKSLLNKQPQEKLIPVYVRNQRYPRK